MGAIPRMVRLSPCTDMKKTRLSRFQQVFNGAQRFPAGFRPPAPAAANSGGMHQSMRFNLGTLPYTFMQMSPDGITLNQVSASVVADVQTDAPSLSQQQATMNNSSSNRSVASK